MVDVYCCHKIVACMLVHAILNGRGRSVLGDIGKSVVARAHAAWACLAAIWSITFHVLHGIR